MPGLYPPCSVRAPRVRGEHKGTNAPKTRRRERPGDVTAFQRSLCAAALTRAKPGRISIIRRALSKSGSAVARRRCNGRRHGRAVPAPLWSARFPALPAQTRHRSDRDAEPPQARARSSLREARGVATAGPRSAEVPAAGHPACPSAGRPGSGTALELNEESIMRLTGRDEGFGRRGRPVSKPSARSEVPAR
jgi:hypothetical protein